MCTDCDTRESKVVCLQNCLNNEEKGGAKAKHLVTRLGKYLRSLVMMQVEEYRKPLKKHHHYLKGHLGKAKEADEERCHKRSIPSNLTMSRRTSWICQRQVHTHTHTCITIMMHLFDLKSDWFLQRLAYSLSFIPSTSSFVVHSFPVYKWFLPFSGNPFVSSSSLFPDSLSLPLFLDRKMSATSFPLRFRLTWDEGKQQEQTKEK